MHKIIPLSLTACLLASCSFIPSMEKPSVEVPQRWTSVEGTQGETAIPRQWWTLYNDPTLDNLITTASTQNLDIRAGIERVNAARAAMKIAGASYFPTVGATAGAEKSRVNPASGATNTSTSLTGGLAVSYELDLFGANAATREVARGDLLAAQYAQESLRLVTESAIAQTYFNLITARERVRIAEQNLKNAREIQRSIQIRLDNGLDSGLELAQQRVAVATSESSLAAVQEQEKIYHNALAVLVGHAPQTFKLETMANINAIKAPDITPSQPSTLLERRPDIHKAEAELMSANADIGAARAAFYPSITLGANAAGVAAGLGDPVGTTFALASALAAPIFQGGALEGGLMAANANQRGLVETYRKTVLVAFQEVEDALAAVKGSTDRQVALGQAVTQAQKAYDISRKRYEVGTIDFQTMLNTQSALLNAQDGYAQALSARLSASTDLTKALGGGWKP